MRVHLVNPSSLSFGVGVITPRWLYVLAAATPDCYGDPLVTDETLNPLDPGTIEQGDVVGIGIHTGNALRGYEIGALARRRGATVVFGGIHATLYPDEAHDMGAAHAVVKGDGDVVWKSVLSDCVAGTPQRIYEAGRIEADEFLPARWSLLPRGRYMWASVQTVRGCPKHCSFCSVWRTDGQRPRQRRLQTVLDEVVELRRKGFRFIALADDNFYPVTLTDLQMAGRRKDSSRLDELTAIRAERFALMAGLAQLPKDMVFFTQITMEAAEDPEFLQAMRRANIKGALVGVEAVTSEGLKDVYKDFNASGEHLVECLQRLPRSRRARAGVVHLRSSQRQARDVRPDGGGRRTRGHHIRAVRAADAVSRHGRFCRVGKDDGVRSDARERHSVDAPLADPAEQPAPCLRRPPAHVAGRNPAANAGRVGSFLWIRRDLETLPVRPVTQVAAGLRADLEAVPADVRQYGNHDRQRPHQPVGDVGALDRQALPAPVCRASVA